jgi:hypothetical protein
MPKRPTSPGSGAGAFFRAESYGFSQEFMDYVKDIPIVPDRGSI